MLLRDYIQIKIAMFCQEAVNKKEKELINIPFG